jgi:hypothetical protein
VLPRKQEDRTPSSNENSVVESLAGLMQQHKEEIAFSWAEGLGEMSGSQATDT